MLVIAILYEYELNIRDVLINEKLNVSLGFLAFVLLLCHNRRILYYTLLLLEAIYAGICGIFDPSRWYMPLLKMAPGKLTHWMCRLKKHINYQPDS